MTQYLGAMSSVVSGAVPGAVSGAVQALALGSGSQAGMTRSGQNA